ncbi:MAG TPA: hypothetical protein VFX21_01295, partial [Acidimicrobiia bacterium]|nr:hypothetical protein [Acidimicrobiia bacterium]
MLDDVYSDDEYRRILEVIKREGPWGTIISHHFTTVDEMIATVTGVVPPDHGLTLDDVAGPHFRGFFGQNSVCFYPEIEDVFYSARFLECVKSYWNAQYAKPTLMLFNICGPHDTGLAPHLDAVSFRGVTINNTPVWLQNIMGKSGLFTDYLVKMAQVITWWYRGEPGGFTYWPRGPFEAPERLTAPMWNKGVVVQNEMMFHRGDPVGPIEDRPIEGMKARSVFGYDPADDSWAVTTDGAVIKRVRPEQIRLLVHWSAEVYADMTEVKKVMDHTDDLTHQQVVDTLLADMRSRGVKVA